MRRAKPVDIPLLVELMADFYTEAGYALDKEQAANAFAAILADQRLGYVWILQEGRREVGHLVVAIRYSMEYGGFIACVDDFYVRPTSRNKGLGKAALIELREFCERNTIRAMTVEVGGGNDAAQAVYRHVGFVNAADRQLLALPLAPPAHAVHGVPGCSR